MVSKDGTMSHCCQCALWLVRSVQLTVSIGNCTPNIKVGPLPGNQWSETNFPIDELQMPVPGCPPVCAPDKILADDKSTPRWEARSQQAAFVMVLPEESGNAPTAAVLHLRNW